MARRTVKELEHEITLLNMQIKEQREVSINLYKSLNPLWGIYQGRFEPITDADKSSPERAEKSTDGVVISDRLQVVDGILQKWVRESIRVELDEITNVMGSSYKSWQRRFVGHALQKFERVFGISEIPQVINGVKQPNKKFVGMATNCDIDERHNYSPQLHPYHEIYKKDTGLVHSGMDRFDYPEKEE